MNHEQLFIYEISKKNAWGIYSLIVVAETDSEAICYAKEDKSVKSCEILNKKPISRGLFTTIVE